jgi:uncharacterized protein YndB with AHSA1/START domain
LSTPEGLSKWIANDVKQEGDQLVFTWGEVWSHHEIRTASVVEEVRGEYIRYSWENDTDEEAYWELRIEKSDITNDYILIITDHALPEDMESLEDIWESNLEQLHHTTGL